MVTSNSTPSRQRPLVLAATVLYWLLAAVILAWGAQKRFSIPQTPGVDPDIRGYLGPAISALTGHRFGHYDGRSFPYPAFVFAVLKCFGSFNAISIMQHFLGLGAGVVAMLAWNAMLRLVPEGGVPREISRFLGLVPAAIYLGSATAIHYEQELRPEALFPFLTIADLWLGLLFLRVRFLDRKTSAIWLGALNVFAACLVYLLKPSFGLATLFSTLPVWVSLIIPGEDGKSRVWLAAAAIIPAVLLLFLPEHLLKNTDAWGARFLPETLVSVHAPIVLDQMSRDLAANTQTPWPRDTIQTAHDLLATDLETAKTADSSKTFPSLGFNPDSLMYDTFCVEFAQKTGWDTPELVRFFNYWYRRAALAHPAEIARKIVTQMRLFYNTKNPAYRLGQSLDVTDEYTRTPAIITGKIPLISQYPPAAAYFQQCQELAGKGMAFVQVKRFTEWTRLLSAHYLDLFAVCLVSPLLILFKQTRRHIVYLVIGLWLAWSYNFGNCLTVAIVHSLEVTRYVRIQLIFTVFSQCASLYLLVEVITYFARRRFSPRPPEHTDLTGAASR